VIDLCLARTLRLSRDADGPQLVQLSLECENARGRGTFYLIPRNKPSTLIVSLSQVELVDFGATRSYGSAFIDNWLRLLLSAARQDRGECLRWSLKLGYLTGEENDVSPLPLSPDCEGFPLTD
jgi:hypothetical protein